MKTQGAIGVWADFRVSNEQLRACRAYELEKDLALCPDNVFDLSWAAFVVASGELQGDSIQGRFDAEAGKNSPRGRNWRHQIYIIWNRNKGIQRMLRKHKYSPS